MQFISYMQNDLFPPYHDMVLLIHGNGGTPNVQTRLRRLLYCNINIEPPPRYAGGKACGNTVRKSGPGNLPVQDLGDE